MFIEGRDFPDLILDHFFNRRGDERRDLVGRDPDGKLYSYRIETPFIWCQDLDQLSDRQAPLVIERRAWRLAPQAWIEGSVTDGESDDGPTPPPDPWVPGCVAGAVAASGAWAFSSSPLLWGSVGLGVTALALVSGGAGAVRDDVTPPSGEVDVTPPSIQGGLIRSDLDPRSLPPLQDITSARSPVLGGLTEPDALVQIQIGDRQVSIQADELGNWTVPWPADVPLNEGIVYQPVGTVTDRAGNVAVQNLRPFEVDITLAPPTAQLSPASDTGPLDGVTSIRLPAFLGTAEPGARVRLGFRKGSETLPFEVETVAALADGAWGVDLAQATLAGSNGPMPPLADGTYTLLVTVQDLAGNQLQTDGPVFTVDATAPLLRVDYVIVDGPAFEFAIDQQAPLPTFKVSDRDPELIIRVFVRSESGAIEPEFDAFVELFVADGDLLGIAPPQPLTGNQSVHIFKFADKSLDPQTSYLFEVFATDLAGNRSLGYPFQLDIL